MHPSDILEHLKAVVGAFAFSMRYEIALNLCSQVVVIIVLAIDDALEQSRELIRSLLWNKELEGR